MNPEKVTLKEVCEINPKNDAKGKLVDNERVSFLPMSSISESGYIGDEETRKYHEVAKGFTAFHRNDVLVAKITPCFENGKSTIATINTDYGFGTTEFHVLRPDSQKLDTRYLHYFVRSPFVREAGEKTMTGSAGQKRVPKTFFQNLKIPLPPLDEQRRIATILDQADALRRKRQQALAKLDHLVQSLFLDMFGDPVTNPKGWEVESLDKVLKQSFQNGAYFAKEFYTNDPTVGVEMVHMSDAFYQTVKRGKLKRVIASDADIQKYAVTQDDILIARRSLNYEGSAKPCLIPQSDEPLIFESSLIRLTPNPNKVCTLYLYHYLANERVRTVYVYPNITKSTISGINQQGLKRIKILLPDKTLQQKFTQFIEKIETEKTTSELQCFIFDTFFHSLQQRAFRGEL